TLGLGYSLGIVGFEAMGLFRLDIADASIGETSTSFTTFAFGAAGGVRLFTKSPTTRLTFGVGGGVLHEEMTEVLPPALHARTPRPHPPRPPVLRPPPPPRPVARPGGCAPRGFRPPHRPRPDPRRRHRRRQEVHAVPRRQPPVLLRPDARHAVRVLSRAIHR